MLPARFEPAIPASERPQTHALDRSATGIGVKAVRLYLLSKALSVTGVKIMISLT